MKEGIEGLLCSLDSIELSRNEGGRENQASGTLATPTERVVTSIQEAGRAVCEAVMSNVYRSDVMAGSSIYFFVFVLRVTR